MKHLVISFSIAIAATLMSLPASAATKETWSRCKGIDGEKAVRACGEIIAGQETPLSKAIALYNRARVHLHRGEFDRAMADLDQSIALSPFSSVPRLQRGITFAWMKAFDRALSELSAAIDLEPKNARAYLERGKVRIWLRDFGGAVGDLSRAIALNPKDPAALRVRAIAFGHMQDLDRAKADISRALRLEAKRSGVRVLQAGA